MSASYGKGLRGKATRLHSVYVRKLHNYTCENCGAGSDKYLQAAHIVSRAYASTRTDDDNLFCLCASCHRMFTAWPLEFYKFVEEKRGLELYEELRQRALTVKMVDWGVEVDRIQAALDALDEKD